MSPDRGTERVDLSALRARQRMEDDGSEAESDVKAADLRGRAGRRRGRGGEERSVSRTEVVRNLRKHTIPSDQSPNYTYGVSTLGMLLLARVGSLARWKPSDRSMQ